jgi:hypothetical protein
VRGDMRRNVGSVAHEAASGGVLAQIVDCWHATARRQADYLIASTKEELIGILTMIASTHCWTKLAKAASNWRSQGPHRAPPGSVREA